MTGLSQEIDWDYFGQAVEYQKQAKYQEAIEIYSELLEVDSNIYGCWKNRGQCFYSLSEYNYALHDFYKAIHLNQSDSSLFFCIGLTHVNIGKWNKGIEFLNYAVEKSYPRNETYFQNIGTCYYFLGKMDSAIKYLSSSYEINPENRNTLTNLAFAYQNSNPSKSCQLFQQVYNIDSLNAQTINNLGYSHYLCGNLNDAYSYYQKALSMDAKNSYLHRNIGLYYQRKNDINNACRHLQKAIELDFIKDWGDNEIEELMNFCQNKK
jgi:tetratricopeptide (TPR) repeat protein